MRADHNIPGSHRHCEWEAPPVRETNRSSVALRFAPGIAVVLCGLSACDAARIGPTPSTSGNPPISSPAEIRTVDSSMLSGAALQALGPDGRFMVGASFFDPVLPTLTRAQAESAAAGFVGAFGATFQTIVSADRGEPISLSALTSCGTALYADSPLAPPPDSLDLQYRIYYGPYWELYLCDGPVEKVAIAIGAYAVPLATTNFGADTGGASLGTIQVGFEYKGLPVGLRAPRHAEEAAARVALLSGRRVIAVPRLVLPLRPITATLPLWAVELDGPVTVRGTITGQLRTRSTLLYGSYGLPYQLAVWDSPDPDPGPVSFTGLVAQPNGTKKPYSFTLQRRPIPAFFQHLEPVTRP